jgi:hypothetical protein
MNPEDQKLLERLTDRKLKALPDLKAPASLARRVMARVEQRAREPWYRQSWLMWPRALQVSSVTVALLLFGGLCYGSWLVPHTGQFSAAQQHMHGWFAGFGAVWSVVNALSDALVYAVKHLGTGIIVGCLAAVGLGYAMCLGLGTAAYRLAYSRR